MMTVRELIDALEDLDADTTQVIITQGADEYEILGVESYDPAEDGEEGMLEVLINAAGVTR